MKKENDELKKQNEKLKYRINILLRSLEEGESCRTLCVIVCVCVSC